MLAAGAVGLLDEGGHEDLLAGPEAHLVPGQEGDLLADLAGQHEVVGGHDDGDAVGLQAGQDAQQGVAVGLVQAVEGLVEQDEPGAAGQAAGEQDPLLLASGELAEAAAGRVAEADGLQGPLRALALGASRPAQRPQGGDGAHDDDVEGGDGEGGVEVGDLRDVADAAGRCASGRPAVDAGGAPDDADHAEQRPQQRRLARAVGADQGQGPARAQ